MESCKTVSLLAEREDPIFAYLIKINTIDEISSRILGQVIA